MPNLDLLEDACDALPHTTKRMFGGHGLFAPNGGMFAGIVTDDQIMLKFADERLREELIALGGEPWAYTETMTMREWILIPDDFYDEPVQLAEWARRAHAIAPPPKSKARKGAAKKAAKKASPKPATKKAAAKKPAKKAASPRAPAKNAAAKNAAAKKPAKSRRA